LPISFKANYSDILLVSCDCIRYFTIYTDFPTGILVLQIQS